MDGPHEGYPPVAPTDDQVNLEMSGADTDPNFERFARYFEGCRYIADLTPLTKEDAQQSSVPVTHLGIPSLLYGFNSSLDF